MSDYPFRVDDLGHATQALLAANSVDGRLKFANQLRNDLAVAQNPNDQVALAWVLTGFVESGVFIDDLWRDIQEAQSLLDDALAREPGLANDPNFVDQQKRTGVTYTRVAKFDEENRAKLAASKDQGDENMDSSEAADIAYASKDPEEIAHYFLLAAKKLEGTNRHQAEWYLNSRVSALLDLERWDEARPQLEKMTKKHPNQSHWIELGYLGLLRIEAAKSNAKSFEKVWKQAKSAKPQIPGPSPQYYKILKFGIENDMREFVAQVLAKLSENDVYNKTTEDEALVELASKYIASAPQTSQSKRRSFFNWWR